MIGTTPLPLNLVRDDGVISLVNTTATAPAGTAAVDIGDVCVTVSLTDPVVPVQISALTTIANRPDHDAVALLRLLAGDEAADHVTSASTAAERKVPWAPADRRAWSVIAGLAHLTHLSVVEGDGSPWWDAEMLTIAEPLLGRAAFDDLQLADPLEAAERCLDVATDRTVQLCRRARQINGPGTLGPIEMLEALARLVVPSDEHLASLLHRRATDIEVAVHDTSTEELDAALARLISDTTRPEPSWLGGNDNVSNPISWLDNPILWIDHDNRNAIIDLVAECESVPSILARLWARAVNPDNGRTLGFARFDAPSLDRLNEQTEATALWSNDQEHLRATIPLPPTADPDLIACDVTRYPLLPLPTEAQLLQAETARKAAEAIRAKRLRSPHANRLLQASADQYRRMGASAEATELDRLVNIEPSAPIGEIDDLDHQ